MPNSGEKYAHAAQRCVLAPLEPPRHLEIPPQLAMDVGEETEEGRITGEFGEPLVTHEPEQPHRVVAGDLPRVGIDPTEQVAGAFVPRPPQVHGEVEQRCQRLRQVRPHREAAQRSHGLAPYCRGSGL